MCILYGVKIVKMKDLKKLILTRKTVFTTEEIQQIFSNLSSNTLKVTLYRAKLNGELLNPQRGVWTLPVYDMNELAGKLFPGGYISLEPVLFQAGVMFQKHELNIRKILKWLFTSNVSDCLWFKWGTLTYLCYWLDRFSTDIDIDILDLKKEQEIIDSVRKILYSLWDVKNETLWKTIHRWIFRYDERSMNIKVEFNKRVRKANTYDIQNIDSIDIHCMTKDSIFWNKLVALYERMKNRDLYDVNFFLKNNFPLNEKLIKERTWKNMKDFISELISILPDHYKQNNILAELWEVLTDEQKIRMKNKALNETIELLKTML